MTDVEFSSLPSFALLGYHLKVLYAIDYFGHALLPEIERTFPSDEVQRLEISTASIKLGKVDSQVVQALIDLIEDDLIKLYVKPYRIEVAEPQGTLLYLLGQMGEIPVGMKTKLLEGQFETDFSFQGAGYWCDDPDTGERIELAEHGLLAHLSLTDKGREVWNLLKTVRCRLSKEAMMAAI